MGYDYYIAKVLKVKYLNDDDVEEIIDIEINKTGCYFLETNDSDDSDNSSDTSYGSKTGKLCEKYLKVTYVPKVLFSNNKWKNEKIQKKYEDIILDVINNGMLLNAIKKEMRYLR